MNPEDFATDWSDEPTRQDIAVVTTEKPAVQYHEVADDYFRAFLSREGFEGLARAKTVEVPCVCLEDEVG